VRASLVATEDAASTCGSVTGVSATGPTAAAAVMEVRGLGAGWAGGLNGQAAAGGDDPKGRCCWLPADGKQKRLGVCTSSVSVNASHARVSATQRSEN